MAEKPNPLNPLMMEAIKTIKIIINICRNLDQNKIKSSFYFLLIKSAL